MVNKENYMFKIKKNLIEKLKIIMIVFIFNLKKK